MQASSDIFLGWVHGTVSGYQYYFRQLHDMKGSFDVDTADATMLLDYTRFCGWSLAHAHARTGDEISIYGYIGKNDTFANAIADFAVAYADQTERDYQALVDAVNSGRVEVQTGI